MRPLPDRKKEAISFIVSYISKNGYPPSMRDIGKAIGMKSSSSVWKMMHKCEAEGHLEIDRSIPRGIRITDSGRNFANS
jgi:repressor LexA